MSADRRAVTAPGAPDAVGPYRHAISAGGLLFCSGQTPLDPESNELVGGPVGPQARRCLQNLEAVSAAAGTTLARAVRIGVFMTDLSRFAELNEAYAAFFAELGADDPPARVTVGVAALPLGAEVEMDAIVALPAS